MILRRESFEAWLKPAADLEVLQAMLVPCAADTMERYTVSREVNSSRSDEARFVQQLC